MISNTQKEEILARFLEAMGKYVFVESTDTMGERYVTKKLNPAIEDQEATIVIKGEWDREDLKNILSAELSRILEEKKEAVGELFERQYKEEVAVEEDGNIRPWLGHRLTMLLDLKPKVLQILSNED